MIQKKIHTIQLILRGPSNLTSIESLLGMTNKSLMSFKYLPKEEKEELLSLNGAKMSLIQVLKGHI